MCLRVLFRVVVLDQLEGFLKTESRFRSVFQCVFLGIPRGVLVIMALHTRLRIRSDNIFLDVDRGVVFHAYILTVD